MRLCKQLVMISLIGYSSLIFAGADTVFMGGPIVTVNDRNEEVQAIAVKDGKIVALGSESDIKKSWIDQTTKVIDLKGQTLMPGFVEPHVHIVFTSIAEGLWLNLSNFTLPYDTLETISEKLKAGLKNVPPEAG